ncbi:hypothetical protein BJ742DRAFT_685328 [Cladochytrium replicatum]|nr:hypothetical protein BJ742DRAFT_685328 [Cladochytrium replicatum]
MTRAACVLIVLSCFVCLCTAVPIHEQQTRFALPQASNREEGLRLISTAENHREWMTEEQILNLIRNNHHFVDVTDGFLENLDGLKPLVQLGPPSDVTHQDLVAPLLANISESAMERFLTKFSSFHTRFYKSVSGTASSEWLFFQVIRLLASNPSDKYTASVRQVHHSFPQSSIIARIEPVSDVSFASNPIVIVGAHLDSVNVQDPMNGRSPGADDDGSGTATLFESLRVLLESRVLDSSVGWSKPIEFHWYAGEEGGGLGSQPIAADYRQRGVNVYAMWQCDMSGYRAPGKEDVIAIMDDYTDVSFSEYVKKLASAYTRFTTVDDSMNGYGGSDHFSWTKAGYPAVFAFDTPWADVNPYIHTPNDDVSHISFSHMAEFAKMIIGWTIELSFE